MPRVSGAGRDLPLGPDDDRADTAAEASAPAGAPSRAAGSAGAGARRADLLAGLTTANAAKAASAPATVATASVATSLPVAVHEALRAAGRSPDDAAYAAEAAETIRRARIAAQRVAGAKGTADGARLTAGELAKIADPEVRRLVAAAAALAAAPEAPLERVQGPARPSGGAGGPKGRVLDTFSDARGREGRYALRMPEDNGPRKPHGVLVYFHADGDEGGYAGYVDRLRATAEAHGLAVVSLQEPDEAAWWAPKSADNSRYVKDFLEKELLARYNIDKSRVFLAGESGGASFAGGLPAALGYEYGGGLLLASGGDIPRANGGNPDDDFSAPPPRTRLPAVPARAKRDLGVYYAVGSEDAELRNTLASAASYRALGFKGVRHDVIPGAGHVGFSAVRAIGAGLDLLDPRRL